MKVGPSIFTIPQICSCHTLWKQNLWNLFQLHSTWQNSRSYPSRKITDCTFKICLQSHSLCSECPPWLAHMLKSYVI